MSCPPEMVVSRRVNVTCVPGTEIVWLVQCADGIPLIPCPSSCAGIPLLPVPAGAVLGSPCALHTRRPCRQSAGSGFAHSVLIRGCREGKWNSWFSAKFYSLAPWKLGASWDTLGCSVLFSHLCPWCECLGQQSVPSLPRLFRS